MFARHRFFVRPGRNNVFCVKQTPSLQNTYSEVVPLKGGQLTLMNLYILFFKRNIRNNLFLFISKSLFYSSPCRGGSEGSLFFVKKIQYTDVDEETNKSSISQSIPKKTSK